MDSLVGVCGKDFVVIAADGQVARSILVYQREVDKIVQLDDKKLLAAGGPQADCNMFTEYIQKNLALYELNNNLKLSTKAAAHFIRRQLAEAIRKGPYQTNCLLGGMDGDEASLYWVDYFGALQKVNYGGQGYASNFTLSTMDRKYKPGLSQEEALALVNDCIQELSTRFLIDQTKWVIKIMTKDGIEVKNL
ncbi:unnamed protein product [Chrysoparadoxa australica]